MNNFWHNLIIAILVIMIIGMYYTKETVDKNIISSEELFERNERCGSYKKVMYAIEYDMSKWYMELAGGVYDFDEIFYSPSRNSCVYSHTEHWFMDTKLVSRTYYITDYFTNETIFEKDDVTSVTASLRWDTKKRELKQ